MKKLYTQEDGHELAVKALREIQAHVAARWERENPTPPGGADIPENAPDDAWRTENGEILRRYISTLSEAQSLALARGFYAVLTETIGSSLNGVNTDLEYFTKQG
jgi:hypothetical protein